MFLQSDQGWGGKFGPMFYAGMGVPCFLEYRHSVSHNEHKAHDNASGYERVSSLIYYVVNKFLRAKRSAKHPLLGCDLHFLELINNLPEIILPKFVKQGLLEYTPLCPLAH